MTNKFSKNLSPSDLVSNWEIYYLNRQLNGFKVESAHMDGFLSHLQNEMNQKIIKEENHLHVYSSNDVEMLLGDDLDTSRGVLGTPNNHHERLHVDSYNSASTPRTNDKVPSSKDANDIINIPITPFGQRINKFTSQFVFNSQNVENSIKNEELENVEDDVIRRVQPTERCNLLVHCLQPQSGCRFMYDPTEDRFNYLDNRIRKHANVFATSGLYGKITDPTLASQNNIFAVGMVCCDGEGRLNEKSILLQGSSMQSGGQRVRVDLQKLAYFSLFPGQMIGVEGHNPSGHCLIASKVVDYLPNSLDPDFPLAKKLAMDQDHQPCSSTNKSQSLSLLIASGPFTTTDNLLFEPLTELLAYASRRQPQLVILMGPFIDSDHPEIKRGTVDRVFDEIFHVEILSKLCDYTKYMGSAARVILLPSIRDAHYDFVFPQPAFDIHLPDDIIHQITCLPNPGFFSANEVTIGCCTIDILKQLSGEEISRIPTGTVSVDRLGRLATHILGQRSYYPLYPLSESVPLDFSLAPETLDIPVIPDLLILPSDLAPFVKVLSHDGNDGEVMKCICVNPGRLAKGIGGGTFVELHYHNNPHKTNGSIIRI
ncbi:DNA polymerase alpha subunit B [Canna indica]|uniref:DNA polymerase alpha subunit B n=1 Tax=Canna indica TaxID=4628 RepID=A0AAQ3KGP7_9LILI|nr:DNA polymerase alpha subunit B [Canna indica]